MTPTIITGPPRCGTYWLARFLAHACGAAAGHEMVNFYQTTTPWVGGIDCNNSLLLSGKWPEVEAKVIWIGRSDWETGTRRWLSSVGLPDAQIAGWAAHIAAAPVPGYNHATLWTEPELRRLLGELEIEAPSAEVFTHWRNRRLSKPFDLWTP